jgi:hypothetical protein
MKAKLKAPSGLRTFAKPASSEAAPTRRKLKAPEASAPPPATEAAPAKPARSKHGGTDGHTVIKLANPIEARKLKAGMRIHYGGDFCRVFRVAPALAGVDLLLIDIREHPTRTAFTTCAHPGDLFFQTVEQQYTE